jgi:hypothetical protein
VGRHLLLIGLLAALAGCGADASGATAGATGNDGVVPASVPSSADLARASTAAQTAPVDDAHADLACAACHDGELPPGRDVPVATTAGCMAAGCHEDGGPGSLTVAGSAELRLHANHPGLGDQARMECAQCHTHAVGTQPLWADLNGCGLCHADQLDAQPAGECITCHVAPEQRPLTSQALAVPHDAVPWIQGGCVRCHFSVAPDPDEGFRSVACTTCHAEEGQAAAAFPPDSATGEPPVDEIHAGHTRVACTSCHVETSHQVEGMSSAVSLSCADCHAVSHDLASRKVAAGLCVTCHTETHRSQQGLLLGLVPWESSSIRPSLKFAAGMACRGCHGVAEVDFAHPDTALSGDPDRCVACHLPEYRTVLEWWNEGGDQRTARARRWVEAARANGVVDPQVVAAALTRIAFVEEGGLVHGPRLADRLLREAVALVVRDAGGAPAEPDLGTPPREGMCSFCHLDPDARWSLDEMPDDFHRDALARSDGDG